MHLCATIKVLDWENHYFGRHTARLFFDTSARLALTTLEQFDLVQAKVDSRQIALLDTLGQLGFRLAEGEIDLQLKITHTERQPGIRIARAAQIPALREAAGKVFAYSRFRPPWYQPDDSARFYAQWIENAIQGTFDNQCLLAVDDGGAMQGFVSLRQLNETEARIGLLGVLPEARCQGVGERLMRAAADWCRSQRLTTLRVATQLSNLTAQRLYFRCGAQPENTSYWLYRTTQ